MGFLDGLHELKLSWQVNEDLLLIVDFRFTILDWVAQKKGPAKDSASV
jgi:hypothetical protein